MTVEALIKANPILAKNGYVPAGMVLNGARTSGGRRSLTTIGSFATPLARRDGSFFGLAVSQ
jgi:hypothetical protein